MTDMSLSIRRRPAQPEDEPFIFEVYSSFRAGELELLPWSEEEKQAFLEMQFKARQAHYHQFPPEVQEIVLYNETPIGQIIVIPTEKEIRLADLILLPAYRNRGIGSALVKALQDRARREGKPITLHVYVTNPGAYRHCTRLGFKHIKDVGPQHFMEWRPDDH